MTMDGRVRRYCPVQVHFLRELRRLVSDVKEYEERAPADMSVFARLQIAYRDCEELGLHEEALALAKLMQEAAGR